MRVDQFDFDLPERCIALRPAEPRDAARLLAVDPGTGAMADGIVRDLAAQLRPGDALVFNDTRVIPARLFGVRRRAEATARVELILHKREGPDRWWSFARPAKRLRSGEWIEITPVGNRLPTGNLRAQVIEKQEGGEVLLAFDRSGAALDEAIAAQGRIPLPPYIASRRAEDDRDRSDYQTVYAQRDGAVAAPTAGLHFTPSLIESLARNRITHHFVTLHVGAGTFLPVKADDTDDHRMHAEFGQIDTATAVALNATREEGGRIVCVGTTSVRVLESACDPDGRIQAWSGDTDIFITPGYRFRAVDVLMTNFHLPKSTLFMLVSAFSGLETMRRAYRHAIEAGYRFYSYGDACLLFRRGP